MKKNENITIRTGENLRKWALEAKEYNKRDLYNDVMRFIYDRQSIKVLALCGLRRTGKTTILRQAALTLLEDNKKVAVIDFTASQDAMDFRTVLSGLRDDGYDYVFIDEATASPDFINISSVLSDDYAASGMKLVLSGTDSLSFVLASKNELYDRCIILKTSYIPYREFERVLGISGVDKYIEYGGTMCMEGTKYHKDVYSPFIDRAATNQYIDSAIAYNIQHSLDYFHDGEFYGRLHTLRARGELTNVINRVVEDKNRELVAYVIDRTYKSRDLGSTVQLAAKHEDYPGGDELRQIDRDAINTALKNALDIRNIEERSIGVTEEHLNDIKRYLQDLGILHEYTVSTYDIHEVWSESIINVIAQPGMRYSQSKTFVELLLKDPAFSPLSLNLKKKLKNRILSDVKGQILEDVILDETTQAYLGCNNIVIEQMRTFFGEIDMIICDSEANQHISFEIKHGKEAAANQVRHLTDERVNDTAEKRYGQNLGKYVIYSGQPTEIDGVIYLNAEYYLKNLEQKKLSELVKVLSNGR